MAKVLIKHTFPSHGKLDGPEKALLDILLELNAGNLIFPFLETHLSYNGPLGTVIIGAIMKILWKKLEKVSSMFASLTLLQFSCTPVVCPSNAKNQLLQALTSVNRTPCGNLIDINCRRKHRTILSQKRLLNPGKES